MQKNIEYNELKAWLAQARQQAASTTASQMAFDASWKTGHLPLSNNNDGFWLRRLLPAFKWLVIMKPPGSQTIGIPVRSQVTGNTYSS